MNAACATLLASRQRRRFSKRLRDFLRAGRESLAQRERRSVSENAPLQDGFSKRFIIGRPGVQFQWTERSYVLCYYDEPGEVRSERKVGGVVSNQRFGQLNGGTEHFAAGCLIAAVRLAWRMRNSMARRRCCDHLCANHPEQAMIRNCKPAERGYYDNRPTDAASKKTGHDPN